MFIYTVQHLSKRIMKSKRLFNKDGGSDVLQKQQYIGYGYGYGSTMMSYSSRR